MYRTIVVPLDGSPHAARVIPFAVRLCPAEGQIVLVQAVAEPSQLIVTNASAARIAAARGKVAVADARTNLEEIAVQLRDLGLRVATRVAEQDASRLILEAASASQNALIVMATHSRAAPIRTVVGSVAEDVVRRAQVPVLLVPPSCDQPWPASDALRVLVTLDGSPPAERILRPAEALTAMLQADLLLLRVADDDAPGTGESAEAYLDRTATAMACGGIRLRKRVVAGNPTDRILEIAHAERAHILAMASHGRSGISRLVMGSVTAAEMARADVPVMVVGPMAPDPADL
jgi:nucleotide-binding universal stress UspA family protein